MLTKEIIIDYKLSTDNMRRYFKMLLQKFSTDFAISVVERSKKYRKTRARYIQF